MHSAAGLHAMRRGRRTWLASTLVGAAILVLAVGANRSGATFPGTNGRVVVETHLEIDEGEFVDHLRAVNPRTGKGNSFATKGCPDGFNCADGDPAASPDGRRVAFVRTLHNEQHPSRDRPVLMTADSNGERLRTLSEPAYEPAWSPSGNWIAYSRFDKGIYLIRPNGTGLRRVTKRTGTDLDWSRRGMLLFSLRRRDAADLYTIRGDGSQFRRLTRAGVSDHPPLVSRWPEDRFCATAPQEGRSHHPPGRVHDACQRHRCQAPSSRERVARLVTR